MDAGALRRQTGAEVGHGFLDRASASVYRVVVLHLLVMVAAAPGLVVVALLTPDVSNTPLLGLALVPVAPALSASIYAWHHTVREDDLQPGRHFWVGYRLNLRVVLSWWVPVVAVLTVLMVDVAHLATVAAGAALLLLTIATLAATALVVVAAGHALVVTSLYTIRTRDLLRLLPFWLRRPGPSVGVLALSFSCLGMAVLVSPWLLLGVAAPVAIALHHVDRPLVADIEEMRLP